MNDDRNISSMSNNEQDNQPVSTISRFLRVVPVLPGEDENLYKRGLKGLITELEAKSVLQVYLAEKIFDCLWWIRRYEEQKRATVIAQMASEIRVGRSPAETAKAEHVFNSMLQNSIDDKTENAVNCSGKTLVYLRQRAMEVKHSVLQQLDQQIALQVKILTGLQSSYEAVTNRKIISERLRLQNELLRKDLAAIDITSDSSHHDKPKAG